MDKFFGLESVPDNFGPSAVAMGNFDGVHRGHQEVLRRLVSAAEVTRHEGDSLRSVALTFDPHPRLVHHPEQAPGAVMSLDQRLESLENLHVDVTALVRYTLDFAAQTPEEFVRSVLVGVFDAQLVVAGHDMRFGRDNGGDVHTLCDLGAQYGFEVDVVPKRGAGQRYSSTWVRRALCEGDVRVAAQVLTRPHWVRGAVVHGAKRGRELGFPTANLGHDVEGFVPADGIYAGWLVDQGGQRWPAAISVGSNPTFENEQRRVEAHVIDRPTEAVEDFDLYGQRVRVEFVERLRPMVAYEGRDALIVQMHDDVVAARRTLNPPPCDEGAG